MSSKFLESDVVDSKIFAGRVLTLLGEIITELRNQHRFLEERLYFPSESRDALRREMDERVDEDEEYDNEVEDVSS